MNEKELALRTRRLSALRPSERPGSDAAPRDVERDAGALRGDRGQHVVVVDAEPEELPVPQPTLPVDELRDGEPRADAVAQFIDGEARSSAPARSEAGHDVVVHDPDGLEVGVDDGRADEREAPASEVAADRIGQRGPRRGCRALRGARLRRNVRSEVRWTLGHELW